MKKYTIVDTGRSCIYTLEDGNKKVNVHIVNTAACSDSLNKLMEHVKSKFESNSSVYQDDAASDQNAQYARVALNSLKSERKILAQQKKELLKRFENLKQPIPLNQADTVFERDLINRLGAMPFAERAKLLLGRLTVEETSALLRHDGDLDRLTAEQPELAAVVVSAHMVHTAANVIAGDHAQTASLNEPLAIGVNMEAARSAAAAKLAIMDAELEAVEAGGRIVAEIARFVAAASDLDADTLFAEIVAS